MKDRLIMLGALALVAGCEAGNRDGNATTGNAAATAEGKAEDGRVTVKAPGVDISLQIPESVRSRMAADADSRILPPGVQVGGVHVQGMGREGGSGGEGSVELSFTSGEAPERLAAWYRDPARAQHFSIGSDAREGAAFVLGGTSREDNGRFTVRLSPRQGGGTDGRLLLSQTR